MTCYLLLVDTAFHESSSLIARNHDLATRVLEKYAARCKIR